MITPLGLYWTQHRTRKQSKGKHHVLNVLSCPVSGSWFSGTASPPSQKPRDVTGAQVVNKVLTWDAEGPREVGGDRQGVLALTDGL